MTLVERPVEDLPRLQAWKAKGKLVTVKDNIELFYIATEGFGSKDSSKPNLLLLHGYPTASFDFYKIWDDLTAKFEVLCWDYAGYGFSTKVYKTIQEQIDLLEELLRNNFADNGSLALHLFSHDLGDTLMQEMLARRDDKASYSICSVVALNGGILPGMHKPTLMQNLMVTPIIRDILGSIINIQLVKTSISKVFGPDTKPTDVEIQEFYALITCNGGRALTTQNIQYMGERKQHKERWVDALQDFAKAGPFLLVDGPADPVSGRHLALAVQDQIDGSKVVFLDDAIGHWPQIEAPQETVAAFMGFHDELGTFR